MKKLSTLLLFAICLLGAQGQSSNASFETWTTESYTLDLSELLPGLIEGPYTHNDLASWTTSNQLSKANLAGGLEFVEQETVNVVDGSIAAKLTTTALTIQGISRNVPGTIVSGDFNMDVSVLIDIFLGGDPNFSFWSVEGTGSPYSDRPEKLVGYYGYRAMPNGSDTCWITSALIGKDRRLIAFAEMKSTNTVGQGLHYFEMPYTYVSCEQPDTIVTAILSSTITPNFSGQAGSILIVDSFALVGTATDLPPIAFDDDTSTGQDESVVVNVVENDIFCDGDNTTPTIHTMPSNGSANVTGSTSIEYTPNAGYSGTDQIEYIVCNVMGCDTATVTIDVIATPPCLANDDIRTLSVNTVDVFDVRLNDVDCGGSPVIVDVPLHGQADVEADGRISYTPTTDFFGVDSFTYSICSPDDPALCDTGTVNITVITGINELEKYAFSIYPNPAKDKLHIQTDFSNDIALNVFDMTGRVLWKDSFRKNYTIPVSVLENGLYFMELSSDSGRVIRRIEVSK